MIMAISVNIHVNTDVLTTGHFVLIYFRTFIRSVYYFNILIHFYLFELAIFMSYLVIWLFGCLGFYTMSSFDCKYSALSVLDMVNPE